MHLRLGIAHKLTLIFALFAATLLGIAGWLAYQRGEKALRESVVAELQEQAIGKQASIENWLSEMLSELAAFAEAPHIVEHMTRFAGSPAAPTGADLVLLNKNLAARTGTGQDYGALFVVDAADGRVIAATHPGEVQRVSTSELFFVKGKLTSGLYLGPIQADDRHLRSITLSAPLRAGNGALVAILVGRPNEATMSGIVNRRAGFRRTDETYLVDTEGNFVSRPRLMAATGMIAADQSEAVRRCLAHNDGLVLADDYREVPTLAVYRWMTEFGLCLITKVDRSEAYAPIGQLANGLVVAGLVLLSIASLASVLLARMITRPIRLIEAGVGRVAQGERNLVLPEFTSDELGRLAGAFNRMTAALASHETQLRRHAAELERRVAEKTRELDRRADALARSNIELERFAYVASHDLQEPLRMVASYTQLLAKRYKGRLDTDADEFIEFAVDGATRMQTLINDLLTYSRVSSQGRGFETVDCEALLDRVLKNLQGAQIETQAIIRRTQLPQVVADGFQLAQLFQNLIGNAIKFCHGRTPEIDIAAKRMGAHWLFSVADNGIGIEAKYFNQLFAVFKRLHTRAEYPGTGIGLAICKKVIERHGGHIWVESRPGEGSTFFFTIPAPPAPDNEVMRHVP